MLRDSSLKVKDLEPRTTSKLEDKFLNQENLLNKPLA